MKRAGDIKFPGSDATRSNLIAEVEVTEEPPAGLPYYGPWGDRETIYLGSPQNKMARGTCPGIMMTDPREVRIAELEQKLADLGVELAR